MAKNPTQSPQEKTVKQSRDKAAKFSTLAVKRTNKALRGIAGIAALSSRTSYTYTADQTAKIFAALDAAVAACKKKYETAASGSGASEGFTL